MIEVWGRETAIRYDGGRVVTTPLRADDQAAVDIGLPDLHRVRIAAKAEGDTVLLLFPRTAEFSVAGVPLHRTPVVVPLERELLTQAESLVEAIENDLLALRRTTPPRPDLRVPRPVLDGARGWVRSDVDAAAARLMGPGNVLREIGILHSGVRADEYVLELAQAGYRSVAGLVVVTSLRVLFVSDTAIHEFPVAAVRGVEVAAPSGPGTWATLRITGGDEAIEFIDWADRDFARAAQALRLVSDMEHVDGSIVGDVPSPTELFAEWELLTERRSLGMVPDAEFHRHGAGIMLAMP